MKETMGLILGILGGAVAATAVGVLVIRMMHWRAVAEELTRENGQLLTAALQVQRDYGQVKEAHQFFKRQFEQFCNKPVQAILHDQQFAAFCQTVENAVKMEMIDKAVCTKCQAPVKKVN